MAKKNSSSWTPSWLRHRSLLTGEVILLVGVVQELIQRQVTHLAWPHYGKVLWLMACTLGVLGVLLLLIRAVVKRSLLKTHEVVRAIPVPLPMFVVHVLIYVALFYLYAWVWALPVWPLSISR